MRTTFIDAIEHETTPLCEGPAVLESILVYHRCGIAGTVQENGVDVSIRHHGAAYYCDETKLGIIQMRCSLMGNDMPGMEHDDEEEPTEEDLQNLERMRLKILPNDKVSKVIVMRCLQADFVDKAVVECHKWQDEWISFAKRYNEPVTIPPYQ